MAVIASKRGRKLFQKNWIYASSYFKGGRKKSSLLNTLAWPNPFIFDFKKIKAVKVKAHQNSSNSGRMIQVLEFSRVPWSKKQDNCTYLKKSLKRLHIKVRIRTSLRFIYNFAIPIYACRNRTAGDVAREIWDFSSMQEMDSWSNWMHGQYWTEIHQCKALRYWNRVLFRSLKGQMMKPK